MKITRRLLALLLALCLTFGNVMPAMATELTNEEPAAVENTTQLAEEPESTEGEVSGTVGIEDNPFDEEPTAEPTVEPTTAKPSTPHEIVDAAYALGKGETLEGTYTLTGKIIGIDTPYDSGYGNITVTIAVEGRETKPIMCFRLKGEGAEGLAKNDIITVTGTLTNYNGTIEFNSGCTLDNVVKGEPDPTDPDAEKPTASIGFADKANRTTFDTTNKVQIWEENGIKLTNSGNIGDYYNPVRLYKNSTVKIEYPGMTKIVFNCANGASYVISADDLSGLGTVTVDGYEVTLELSKAADSVEFVAATAQRRLDSIDVYATGTPVTPPVEPTEPAPTEPKPTEPAPTEPKPTEPAPTEPKPTEPAGDDEQGLLATFTFGDVAPSTWLDGNDVGASKSYTSGNYTLALTGCSKIYAGGHDADGKNFLKFGTSSVVGTLTFEVPEDVTSVELHLASYKAKTSKYTINGGAAVTLTAMNNDTTGNGSKYDVVTVDTSVNKTITLATVSGATRMVMYAVLFYGAGEGGTTTPTEPTPTEPTPTEPKPTEPAPTEPKPTEPAPTEPTPTEPKPTEPAGDVAETATLSFATTANRVSQSTTEQVWKANDITFTNLKGASTSNIIDSSNPVRLYKSSTVKVEYPVAMTKIEFTAYDSSYANALAGVLGGLGTVVTDAKLVTLVLTTPATSVEFVLSGGQVRMDSLTVYTKDATIPEAPENTDPAPDSVLTVAEALALAESKDAGVYTAGKYYVTGKLVSIANTQYGNLYIADEAGTELYIYGINGWDNLETRPAVGDTLTVYGVLGKFNTTAQMKNATITEHIPAGGEPVETEPVETEPVETQPAEDPEIKTGVAYNFGMIQENVSTSDVYYITGAMNGYYMDTTTDVESAADVYVEATEGGFYFYAMVDGAKKYINMVVSGTHVNGAFEDTASTVYTYDNDKATLIAVVNGEDYWFGTRNDKTYTTVGPVMVSYNGFYCKFYAVEEPGEPDPTEPPAPGTEGNPEQIMFQWNEDGTAATAVIVIPANTDYYFTFVTGMMGGDMMLTIDGEPYGIVNGSRFQPVVMALRNGTDVEETHTLVLTYPQGSQMNPDTLNVYVEGVSESEWDGFNQVWLEEGDPDGYLFSWTADADGQLTIKMENGAAGWSYSITNENSYYQTDAHYSCDIPNVNAETIDVKAGDLIQVMVNSCGEDAFTIPGGNVAFTASFFMTPGSASNPIDVDFTWNDEYTAAEVDVTVPANTTYYVRAYGIGGMMLSIDGAEATKLEGNPRMPVIIELVNDTAEEKTFNLCVTHAPAAEGSLDNPAVIELGETVATLEAGSQGYHYKYTATDRGTLTVAVSGNSWTYNMNNITANIYGDTHWHDDDPVVATETVAVNKGDEIVIMVNTYDPMNPWSAPAGTVTLNLSMISEPQGTIGNPIALESGYNSFELAEGDNSTYYSFKATEAGTLNVSVYDAEYGELMPTFTINGETVESVELAEGEEAIIHVQCAGPGTVAVELYFEAVPGSINNPIVSWDPTTETHFTINPDQTAYFSARNVGGSNLHIVAFGSNEMVLTLEGETYSLIEGEELVIAIPDSGMGFYAPPTVFSVTNYSWDYAGEVVYYFGYEPGHETNPVDMVLGKNTAKIEAGTQGFYYTWTATGSGFLELTMNTKTGWYYEINNLNSYAQVSHWSDETPVPTKGYLAVNEGDEVKIVVNTYDPENPWSAPAGTVAFTAKMIQSYNDKLASGKSMTLKYINPTNGKTVANSSVKWEMFSYQLDEWGDKMMDEETFEYITIPVPAEIATLKAGKLTAAAGLTEPVEITVKGTYGATENIYNITIYPATTEIRLDACMYGEEEGAVVNGVNGTTLSYNVGHQYIELAAVVNPDAALQDVTWTSSNKKILTINEFEDGSIGLEPVVDAKNMKVGTGTVTITATAKDGSGVKASVKVNVTCTAIHIDVSSKNGQTVVGSGKSLTMVANVPFAVNKAVTWDVKVVNVPTEDFDHASVATISAKGVLTAKKGLTVPYTVEVSATAKDGSGVVGTTEITIAPVATKVVIDAPATHDLTTGDMIYVTATALSMSGETVLHSSNDVKWTVSDKKIATVEYVEEYSYEVWDYVQVPVLFLTGKTGKVTLTATATDGSNVKKSVTINVVKSPETLTLSAHDVVLAVGKSLTLKATVGPNNATDKKVIWSAKALTYDPVTGELVELTNDIGLTVKSGKVSLNTKKVQALIKETGNYPVIEVTATANMADPYGEYATDTCMIQLCAATTKVSIIRYGTAVNGKTLTIDDDAVVVLGVDYEPSEAGYYHNWKSSNTKLATVTENWDGTVTVKPVAGKVGTVTITATAADGTGKYASVKIKIVRKVDAIEVDTSSFALSGKTKGNTFDLNKLITISPSNASNKKVTWSISSTSATLAAENKITLSAAGKLTAKKNVEAPVSIYVTAKAADGLGATKTFRVTITPAVTGITIKVYDEPVTDIVLLSRLEMLKVTADAEGEFAADVFTWKSSNTKVAKIVVEDGEVYVVGVKAGTAKITATAKDGSGKYATITVKVLPDKA